MKGRLFMGQGSLKTNRRALRKTAREEKNNIVTRYMSRNWDKIVVSAITIIRQFNFKNRFQIAMAILFKPIKNPQNKASVESGAAPAVAAPAPKPQVSGA
jgi:hypothetical protein